MNINDLRKKSEDALNSFVKQSTSSNNKSEDDGLYFKPHAGKDGTAQYIIRFLPPAEGSDKTYISEYRHWFKNKSQKLSTPEKIKYNYYVARDLSTFGLPDPCSEYNKILWNKIDDDSSPYRAQARKQKRLLKYIANIYIVNDPNEPENNGKVKLYAFGSQIFNILSEAAKGIDGVKNSAISPFSIFGDGANFLLSIKTERKGKIDMPNYTASRFLNREALFDNDDSIMEVYNQEHNLDDILVPTEEETYDKLKARLLKVLEISETEFSGGSPSKEYEPEASTPKPEYNPSASSNSSETDEYNKMMDDDIPF